MTRNDIDRILKKPCTTYLNFEFRDTAIASIIKKVLKEKGDILSKYSINWKYKKHIDSNFKVSMIDSTKKLIYCYDKNYNEMFIIREFTLVFETYKFENSLCQYLKLKYKNEFLTSTEVDKKNIAKEKLKEVYRKHRELRSSHGGI